jgi:geranylgeranyl reductase family protein
VQSFDILIVGGGPAGSTLAHSLKDSGLSTAILDKASFPRQKVCAGWVTPEVIKLLNIDLKHYANGRVLQPIGGFRTGMIGQKQVQSHFEGDPVSYGIRRIEFDDYLLQRSGAELILDQSFRTMNKTDDGWCVNDAYQAKLVVGAGGHYCPVTRAIGSKGVSETAVVAQELEFEMSPEQKQRCQIEKDVPELFFTPDLKGYGWVFRKGDYLNIGLGREDKKALPAHVKAFCDYLENERKIPAGITAKYAGHAYLLYNHAVRDMLADNVLLIGDAAGLAYPQSGEGIRPAVESALIAAGVIRESGNNYSKANLQGYQRIMELRFGKRLPAPSVMERLPVSLKKFFARSLMKTRWFSKNTVIKKWFLQSHRKPLL